jgi:hypothetical protein
LKNLAVFIKVESVDLRMMSSGNSVQSFQSSHLMEEKGDSFQSSHLMEEKGEEFVVPARSFLSGRYAISREWTLHYCIFHGAYVDYLQDLWRTLPIYVSRADIPERSIITFRGQPLYIKRIICEPCAVRANTRNSLPIHYARFDLLEDELIPVSLRRMEIRPLRALLKADIDGGPLEYRRILQLLDILRDTVNYPFHLRLKYFNPNDRIAVLVSQLRLRTCEIESKYDYQDASLQQEVSSCVKVGWLLSEFEKNELFDLPPYVIYFRRKAASRKAASRKAVEQASC